MVKALKGSHMIKTTHLDVAKYQTDIKDNEFLTTTTITVKGMYNNE